MLGQTFAPPASKKASPRPSLARLAGVSRRHLAALEKGANVSVLVLKKVASVLDLTEIELGDLSCTPRRTRRRPLNMPLLADTIREAHTDALRAAVAARARRGAVGRGEEARRVVARFPKLPPRARRDAAPRHAAPSPTTMRASPSWPIAGEMRQGEPVVELTEAETVRRSRRRSSKKARSSSAPAATSSATTASKTATSSSSSSAKTAAPPPASS